MLRDSLFRTGLCLAAVTTLSIGCQNVPQGAGGFDNASSFTAAASPRASYQADFGDDEAITLESVQTDEMLLQRAQLEFKGGGFFPFDLLDPGNDPRQDIGGGLGTKFSFEVAKNLYMGFSFDWSRNEVEDDAIGSGEQIAFVDDYDRYNFLANIDYDIPLLEGRNVPLFRLGFGTGMVLIDAESSVPGESLTEYLQIVFRPSIGLRFPLNDDVLLFTEASMDFVPEKSLKTEGDARVLGERPIFDTGILWFGIAFQFD